MDKLRNISGDARYLPALDVTVSPGDVFDVADPALAANYAAQTALFARVAADALPQPTRNDVARAATKE